MRSPSWIRAAGSGPGLGSTKRARGGGGERREKNQHSSVASIDNFPQHLGQGPRFTPIKHPLLSGFSSLHGLLPDGI